MTLNKKTTVSEKLAVKIVISILKEENIKLKNENKMLEEENDELKRRMILDE